MPIPSDTEDASYHRETLLELIVAGDPDALAGYYDGRAASWFRIGLNAWRSLRNTPPGMRIRRALRAPAPPEEQPA